MIKFDLKFVEWKMCSVKKAPVAVFAYGSYKKECTYEEVRFNAEECRDTTPFECSELEAALLAHKNSYVGQKRAKANDNKNVALELEDMGALNPKKTGRVMPLSEPDSFDWGLDNQKILCPDAYILAKKNQKLSA